MMFASAAFSPLSLSPALWLDASDASTLYSGASLAAADGAISEWRDKSGNARHATQATGVSQPLRKTAIQNGRDVVRFDGSNDFLVCASGISMSSSFIFAVSKITATIGDGGPFYYGNGTSFSPNYNFVGVAKGFAVNNWYNGNYNNPTERSQDSGVSVFSGTPRLVCGAVNDAGGKTRIWIDGTERGTATTSTAININAGALPRIGGRPTTSMTGDISEILVFPTALSDADRGAVESYLNSKWAIY